MHPAAMLKYAPAAGKPALPTALFLLLYYVIANSDKDGESTWIEERVVALRGRYYGEGQEFCVVDALWRPEAHNTTRMVTLITQGSTNRLGSLTETLRVWPAPVSLMVYTEAGRAPRVASLLYELVLSLPAYVQRRLHIGLFWQEAGEGGCDIDVLIRASCGASDRLQCVLGQLSQLSHNDITYPVNVARNLARSLPTGTPYELVADSELIPAASAHAYIEAAVRWAEKRRHRRNTTVEGDKRVLVIPVFEVSDTVVELPRDKKELYAHIQSGGAVHFHEHQARECHRGPHAAAWTRASADRADPVFVSSMWIRPCWEPVYVAPTGQTPRYDERFRGYGRNKIEQAYELCRAGYTFDTLRAPFLMHRGIARMDPGRWLRIRSIVLSNGQLFETFRRELDAKYAGGDEQRRYCDGAPSADGWSASAATITRLT